MNQEVEDLVNYHFFVTHLIGIIIIIPYRTIDKKTVNKQKAFFDKLIS